VDPGGQQELSPARVHVHHSIGGNAMELSSFLFAKLLDEICGRLGHTQADFARLLDIHRTSLYKMRVGKIQVGKYLCNLAEVSGLPVWAIVALATLEPVPDDKSSIAEATRRARADARQLFEELYVQPLFAIPPSEPSDQVPDQVEVEESPAPPPSKWSPEMVRRALAANGHRD
jgi:hypothetical protein